MNSDREKIIGNLLPKDESDKGGLRVLMISTDRNIFNIGSPARERMIEYGKLFRQLHIIIFTKRFQKFKAEKICENVWIYPTRSWSRWFYPFGAVRVADYQFGNFLPRIIDVISTQDPFETAIAGSMLSNKFKIPLQIQVHTDFLNRYFLKESLLNKIRVIIGKYTIRKAKIIRVVSERIKKTLIANFGNSIEPKIKVLPIFVDTEKLISAQENFDVRKKYPQFSFIIMMASRLEKEKNISLAIEMMRNLVKSYPKIGLLIVGEGREKKRLKRLVSLYDLGNNVLFEGWQNDLISYYKTSSLFFSTSFYEGYGLTIIEALSCGCPVVSSDVGIAKEVISEGENGFVCPIGDKNCFERKILEIMETPGLRVGLSVNSKALISEKLVGSKEDYLQKYKQAVEDCLK